MMADCAGRSLQGLSRPYSHVICPVANSASFVLLTAMYVDVVTYLFNFMAERLKHGHSDMSSNELRLHRLYLELVPPTISVLTLVGVTAYALQQAIDTLLNFDPDETEPDLAIMLWFSGLNLLLDFLNVGCFARVDQAVIALPGTHTHHHHQHHHVVIVEDMEKLTIATESTPLVQDDEDLSSMETPSDEATGAMNLNMCSAWTHIFADTLRSIAVLIAAGFARLYPNLLSAADADSLGAIVVSIIILVSLAPLIQGLYLTFRKIQAIWSGQSERHVEFAV